MNKFTNEVLESVSEISFILLFIGILILFNYFFKRTNAFTIAFGGGDIAFETSLYNKLEIDEFQKQLRRAKDVDSESIKLQTVSGSALSYKSYSGVADELTKYADLLQNNMITMEEFETVKKSLMNGGNRVS